MASKCPSCGTAGEANAKFCERCGARLVDVPDVVVEIESGRQHVQSHASQLRFRLTSVAEGQREARLWLVLYGYGQQVEQDPDERSQSGTFRKRGEQLTVSFPFRASIPGEFPVRELRLIVGQTGGEGSESLYELPDRSLFVRVADPDLARAGGGINITGGIHLRFDQLKEMYGSDIRNLLSLDVQRPGSEAAGEPQWQAIGLRPVGAGRVAACALPECGRPIAGDEAVVCDECGRTLCCEHLDDEMPTTCTPCAEKKRQAAFQQQSSHIRTPESADEAIRALAGISQTSPAFRARVWTQRAAARTTRDIATVPKDSKGSYAVGERFCLNAQADRDCYLSLVDVGTSGSVYLLLHNHPLRAGPAVQLSGPDASHEWVVGGPPGIERLKAFFTLEPLALFGGKESFSALGEPGQTRDVVSQITTAGTTLDQMPAGAWADASCEFVVSAQ